MDWKGWAAIIVALGLVLLPSYLRILSKYSHLGKIEALTQLFNNKEEKNGKRKKEE